MNETHPITTDCGDTCDCNDEHENADNEEPNTDKTMTEDNNPFTDVSNLTVDAVREQSAAVDERIEKLESEVHETQDAAETLSAVTAYLDLDDEDTILGEIKARDDERETLQATVDEQRESELDDLRSQVTDNAEYTDDEVAEMDEDHLEMLLDAIDRLDADDEGDDETSVKTPTTDSGEESSEIEMAGVFDPREMAVN